MLILTASAGGNPIEIGNEWTTIGRSDQNSVVITDGSVSSRHGEVKSEGALLHVRDLGSSNGTFVNGQRVTTATLQPGDSLNLGQVALVWRPPSAALAPSDHAPVVASPPYAFSGARVVVRRPLGGTPSRSPGLEARPGRHHLASRADEHGSIGHAPS